MNTAREARMLAHAMPPVWNDPPSLERAMKAAQRAAVRRAALADNASEYELARLDSELFDATRCLKRTMRALGIEPNVIGDVL